MLLTNITSRSDLYPQADNVVKVRTRLANASRDGRTVGDGTVLDALYIEEGDVERAAYRLASQGLAPETAVPVPSYRYKPILTGTPHPKGLE